MKVDERGSLRQEQRSVARSRVLAACVELAVRHGGFSHPERFTYARIAELAGVSERTVYRLFPTKAELVRAYIEDRSLTGGRPVPTDSPDPTPTDGSGAEADRAERRREVTSEVAANTPDIVKLALADIEDGVVDGSIYTESSAGRRCGARWILRQTRAPKVNAIPDPASRVPPRSNRGSARVRDTG